MRASISIGSVFLMLLSGCGASADATGGGLEDASLDDTSALDSSSADAGPTVDQACAALAKARCALLDSCTNGVAIQSSYGDLATCEARQLLGCQINAATSSTSQTAGTLQACADVAGTTSCWDRSLNLLPAPCVPLPGALTEGQACIAAAQCASTWCTIQTNAVSGVCTALPKAGDSCATTSCGRGLECAKNTAGAEVCFDPLAVGGACDKDHHCGPNVICVGLTKTAAGVCKARGATVGAACESTNKTLPDCATSLGLFCDSTGHCKAATAAKDAEACGITGTDTVAYCGAAGTCIKAAATDTAGVCKVPAADGTACDSDPSKGPDCLSPAKCVAATSGSTTGICTLPKSN